MKHIARIFLFAVLVPLLLVSCKGKGFQDIAITSVRLVSIVPEGFNDVTALVEIGVRNPSVAFTITGLDATARFQGQDALSVHADQLMVPGHSDKLYRIPLQGSIAEGFNPLRLLRLLAKDASYEDVTFDIHARVAARGGLGKNIEILDIPLSGMLKQSQTESNEIKTTE